MGAAAASVAAVGMKAVAAAVPDPIYDMIEAHRKAAAEHIKAVRTQFAFEEAGSIKGERRKGYDHLEAAVDVAWDAMNDAGCDLVNTRPTTLAGILALCRYIEPLFGEGRICDLDRMGKSRETWVSLIVAEFRAGKCPVRGAYFRTCVNNGLKILCAQTVKGPAKPSFRKRTTFRGT
jgi:hypothetical protein